MFKAKPLRNTLFTVMALLLVLLLVSAALAYRAGYTPRYIAAAPAMLVGFSAKMSCSLYYVSQQSKAQVHQDIVSYSSLFGFPTVVYDDARQRVSASFLGREQQAQYRQGAGCTLVDNHETLPAITTMPLYPDDPISPQAEASDFDKKLGDLLAADNAQQHDTRALLVMRGNGDVIGQAYAEDYHAQSLFLGWSMSKTFTAALIGSLQYRNVIAPFEKEETSSTAPLFIEWQKDARKTISLIDLLTMTSGLAFSELYEPGSDATKMLFEDKSSSLRPLGSSMAFPAGEHWLYSSGTANLLSLYAHRALGNSVENSQRYIQEYLLHPLGMKKAVLELDREGVFVGSSFMFATAQEWANLGALFLNGGTFNDYQMLNAEWVQQAQSPNRSKNDSRYGFQLWLNQGDDHQPLRWPSLPANSFAARGNRGQLIMVVPEYQLVIVRLGWGKPKYPEDAAVAKILAHLP
ncbi:serine hydrolase domain-containing protein [Marinagarivorans cellulosilyticus]|uniref:Beta-lactamase-related domain-containing protein n=1 Tax=Marinagarivorans cellulosilyticus TaxID=2721545 RepID=A0AAN1WH20_9GAMM|nr:serine hydrolase [Marinagarivorans cellulosilyticus]BCD97465.1 hypothetical protein MARGE09_P1666 [Marinagarivorans cellulosilyticus]